MRNQLNHLLYSTSQYDDDDEQKLNQQFDFVHDKYSKHFPQQSLNEDDALELGNGESIEYDHQNSWNNQQNVRDYFREVAGPSYQFSQQFSGSLSINKHDFLQPRGLHDNSLNLEGINIQNILENKKKQAEKVNEVVQAQIEELLRQINKQKCLIEGQKKQLSRTQQKVQNLEKTNEELEQGNRQLMINLQKRDRLFDELKTQYKVAAEVIHSKQNQFNALNSKCIALQKQNERLNEIINQFSQQEKDLTDFRSKTIKRMPERSISPIKQYHDKEQEKMKREVTNLQTQNSYLTDKLAEQKERLRSLDEDYKRKISLKQKKIRQIEDSLQETKQQINKSKKSTQASVQFLKEKLQKQERQTKDRDQKIRHLQERSKSSLEEIRKKQDKIKQLLSEIETKNKMINEVRDSLQQEEARNQIESKLQKQREQQIDKLEQQVNQLKKQRANLKLQLKTMEKPSSIELKLKKQLDFLMKTNEKLTKENKQLAEDANNFQKEALEKDEKIWELKKKSDEANRKIISSGTLSKKKSSGDERQLMELKEIINKLTKENNQLKKNAQLNQQKLNKLFIMESRLQQHCEQQQDHFINQNDLTQEEHISALQQELEFKDEQIYNLKQSHQMEIIRLGEEIKTLESIIKQRDEDLIYKEKTIDHIHQKFAVVEKQNIVLRANRNILHSDFYDDQSYEEDSYHSSKKMLQNKIRQLEAALQQKQSVIAKISNTEREVSGLRFENNKLKSRVKQLMELMLNTPNRRIAPESMNQQQTIEFLEKTLKRIQKSNDILTILARKTGFKDLLLNLCKTLENKSNYNHSSHTLISNYTGSGYRK